MKSRESIFKIFVNNCKQIFVLAFDRFDALTWTYHGLEPAEYRLVTPWASLWLRKKRGRSADHKSTILTVLIEYELGMQQMIETNSKLN